VCGDLLDFGGDVLAGGDIELLLRAQLPTNLIFLCCLFSRGK
jgi:hypothetical protein